MASLLQRLNDDVIIIILCLLPVADIISSRKTCKRLSALSRLHMIWQAACLAEVVGHALTFPHSAHHLPSMSQRRLERLTLRALQLHKLWDPVPTSPSHSFTYQASHSVPVAHVKFLGGRHEQYLAVVTQGIWSAVRVWDLGTENHGPACIVAEWSPRKSAIVAFATNTDPESDGTLAVAVQPNTSYICGHIVLLSFLPSTDDTSGMALYTASTIDLPSIADNTQLVLLQGNHIILCDISHPCNTEHAVTIMDWKTHWSATLQLRPTHRHIQAVLIPEPPQIAILQPTTLDFFALPPLCPPGTRAPAAPPLCKPAPLPTNGTWPDFFAATLQPRAPPAPPVLGIVLREQQADPWSERAGSVRLHACALPAAPRPGAAPSTPEPRERAAFSWPRGALRCPAAVLGARGTLALLAPREHAARGLTVLDVPGAGVGARGEALVLARGAAQRAVWWNGEEYDTWTALDYDEAGGRVVLGSGYGRVTVLVL